MNEMDAQIQGVCVASERQREGFFGTLLNRWWILKTRTGWLWKIDFYDFKMGKLKPSLVQIANTVMD